MNLQRFGWLSDLSAFVVVWLYVKTRAVLKRVLRERDDVRDELRAIKEQEAAIDAGRDFLTAEFYEEVLQQHWWRQPPPQ